jgi:hypothetical protein
MSYLKGPLKKQEISELMMARKGEAEEREVPKQKGKMADEDFGNYESYNTLDGSIPQYYEIDTSGQNRYLPTLGAETRVGFFNQSRGIDEQEEERLVLPLEPSDTEPAWERAQPYESDFSRFPTKPADKVKLGRLPDFILEDKGLKQAKRALEALLYREKKLELYRVKSPKMESKPYESLGDFKVRLQDALNEKKEEEIDKLKERYEKKERVFLDRMQRAKARLSKEESDVTSKTTDTVISAGIAVLGALFGRSSTAKIGSTINKGSRILKEQGDVSRAEQRVQEIQQKIDDLGYELEDKIDVLEETFGVDRCKIETFAIKPRKTDIDIGQLALVWRVG